jgi:tetratricopeptide (TPR) repeat protein
LAEAVAAFERVVRLDPDWALNHASLGALYAAQGNMASAQNELRTAATRAPRAAVYHLNLGAVAEATGDAAGARQAYAEALRLWPDWAEAYFWRATPFRAAFLAEWRQSTPPLTAPSVADLQAAIAGGEPYDLPYAQLAEAYLRAGRLPEAARLLQQADLAYSHRNEDKLEVLWAKAELAAARGDYKSAATFGDQAWAGFRDQSIFGPGDFGDPAYGPFLFRREAMAVDMVPQLIVIQLTDPWAERMVQLGDWYTLLGDSAGAAAIYHEVLTLVPDNAEVQARLQP